MPLSAFLSGIFGIGQQQYANQYNKESLELQNQFNREMSQEQMKYNAEQAQLNRDFQERYFQNYQSIPAQVQQMKEAGINPALMYGSSPAPGSTASGSSASASLPSSASAFPFQTADLSALAETISVIKDIELKNAQMREILEKLQPTIDKLKADTEKVKTDTRFTEKEIDWYDTLTSSTVRNLESSASKSDSDVTVNRSIYKLNLVNKDLQKAKLITEQFIQEQYQDQARLNSLEEEYRAFLNVGADLDVRMKAVDAIYKAPQVEALTKKLMQEANLSEKEAKWFAVQQVTDIIFGISGIASSLLSTGVSAVNAGANMMNAKTNRMNVGNR